MKKTLLKLTTLGFLLGLTSCGHTHNIVSHEAKAPTCTEVGYYSYEECTKCDYTTYEEIEVLDHDLEYFELVETTCTVEGRKEYFYCWVCENYFTNLEGTQQISDEDLIISRKEHIDENNDYVCDYDCGNVLITKEKLQEIIIDTLSSTKVIVNQLYIPSHTRTTYYFDDNLLYINNEEEQEKYYYNESETTYLLIKANEWEKEISPDEVSYNLSYLFEESYDLQITGNIGSWTGSSGALEDKKMIRYTNSFGTGVALKINEEGKLIDAILFFNQIGSFVHEFVITYGENEAIVEALEHIIAELEI